MAILQTIGGRERDPGGFVVRRLLPHEGRQMVGPFIFFDHLGPARFAPGQGIDGERLTEGQMAVLASSRERNEQAKLRWSLQQFAAVPGESEYIPLPHP